MMHRYRHPEKPEIKARKEQAVEFITCELKKLASKMDKDGVVGHYNWRVKSEIRPHLEEIVSIVHHFINSVGDSSPALFLLDDELRKIKLKVNKNLNISIGLYLNENKKIEVGIEVQSARGKRIMHLEIRRGHVSNKVYIYPVYSGTTRLRPGFKINKGKTINLMTGIAIPITPIFNAKGFVVWEAVVGNHITHIEEIPPPDSDIDL